MRQKPCVSTPPWPQTATPKRNTTWRIAIRKAWVSPLIAVKPVRCCNKPLRSTCPKPNTASVSCSSTARTVSSPTKPRPCSHTTPRRRRCAATPLPSSIAPPRKRTCPPLKNWLPSTTGVSASPPTAAAPSTGTTAPPPWAAPPPKKPLPITTCARMVSCATALSPGNCSNRPPPEATGRQAVNCLPCTATANASKKARCKPKSGRKKPATPICAPPTDKENGSPPARTPDRP